MDARNRLLLAVLAAAGLTLWIVASAGGSGARTTPRRAVEPSAAEPVAVPRARVPVAPAELGALDPAMLSADALRAALADYKASSLYPPGSQRFGAPGVPEPDAWNQPIVSDLLLDDRPGQETMYRFTSDRHHVGFGDALVSTMEVWPVDQPEERLPLIVSSAVVLSAAQGRTGIDLTYRDDGQDGDRVAGDHVYTNRFVPAEHDELGRAMRVRISARVEARGVPTLMTLDFTYTPRPLLELDGVSTKVQDGSLAITLALQVHEPGRYLLGADVFAKDGPALGKVEGPWIELAAGPQVVTLSLFGRVLRDAGTAGPYLIRGIRATRHDSDDEIEAWWSDGRSFETEAFALADFSDAPWDGPERRAAIAALERSIVEEEEAERADQRAQVR